ncbi:MAG: ATP-binding protein, partial [Ktedonobacteraceae bacterium]|nr:ATP-binding protein [Ktedonobacteraceae bacterium]
MSAFPLSAMVGQQKTRLALVLNAIDPLIGGVLICGRRGTGKSTAVRALANLLPPLTGVSDCPYFCDPYDERWMCAQCHARIARAETLPRLQRPVPLVTLPLHASEDRVSGSFDLATALEQGALRFEPGVLAQANRGILYIDEINLLSDHIVDLLLDAAALGVHHVERDGISLTHPARFILVGTMNPEEGELRPQLLERIGLFVTTEDLLDPTIRVALVERRLAYDASPAIFIAQWFEAEKQLRERILCARDLLPSIALSAYQRRFIAYLVDHVSLAQGHRGDLMVARTARALAAWENRSSVLQSDIEQAAALALAHRSRSPGSFAYHLSRALEQFSAALPTDQPQELATLDDDLDLDRRRDEREGAAGLSRPLRGADDLAQLES